MAESFEKGTSEASSSLEEIQGFGKGVNEFYNHFVTVADAKAAGMLAANLFVLGGFTQINLGSILVVVPGVLLLTSLMFSLAVVFPRTSKSKKGLIFWGDVSEFTSPKEYLEAIQKCDKNSLEIEYATQNWHVSKVLKTKNTFIRWSVLIFIVGILSYVILYFAQ